jgi:hypothetical protein
MLIDPSGDIDDPESPFPSHLKTREFSLFDLFGDCEGVPLKDFSNLFDRQ